MNRISWTLEIKTLLVPHLPSFLSLCACHIDARGSMLFLEENVLFFIDRNVIKLSNRTIDYVDSCMTLSTCWFSKRKKKKFALDIFTNPGFCFQK